MSESQIALLRGRFLGPLFLTQFLGALNDNLFKNAMVVALLYTQTLQAAIDPRLLTTLAAGIFILPFVLLSATGGQLADRFDKARIMRVIKIAEIAIAALGAAALLSGGLALCYGTLFLFGAHSALFGPCKYAILPQHLAPERLVAGNALVNTGTFLAILLGTLLGTSLTALPQGTVLVSALMIAAAALGWAASRLIPAAPPVRQHIPLALNIAGESFRILRTFFTQERAIRWAALGIAWFYFMGAMYLAQLPNFVQGVLRADAHTLSLFLVLFSVGIGAGGLFNQRLLGGAISARLAPYALAGISLFSLDLIWARQALVVAEGDLIALDAFLQNPAHWRLMADTFLIALCGGLFVVPLHALLQHRAPADIRARLIAGGAILNALFMVGSSVFASVLLAKGLSVPQVFLAFALLNLLIAAAVFTRRAGARAA